MTDTIPDTEAPSPKASPSVSPRKRRKSANPFAPDPNFARHARRLFVAEADGVYRKAKPKEILATAESILQSSLVERAPMDSPSTVSAFLRARLGAEEREVFGAMYLDSQNRLIAVEDLFFGSITQASVHPREVVKACLKHNASGLVVFHCHPSQCRDPSTADEFLTAHLKTALALVEVRLLDHFIITAAEVTSFAQRGLL